jgi:hypothetical protein
MDEDPFASILRRADGDALTALHAPALANPQHVVGIEHEHRIHAWLARHPPFPADLHVGRQVGGGVEALGEHAVGRRGHEARGGCGGERRVGEVGMVEGGHG